MIAASSATTSGGAFSLNRPGSHFGTKSLASISDSRRQSATRCSQTSAGSDPLQPA